MSPDQYLKVVSLGFNLSPPPFVSGLCGRIIRGKTVQDFEKLSDDPNRLIVFLTDSNGLSKMFGKTGYEMLITVGHHPDHIAKQLAAGKSYKFVVFPESEAQPATWDGLFKATQDVYPDLAGDLLNHSTKLRTSKYAEWELAANIKFADVDDPAHPEYVSYQSYKTGSRDALALRRLMYHTLHIRELFRGDGFTYDEQGRRGVREYLMPNKAIADIKGSVIQDLDVRLP